MNKENRALIHSKVVQAASMIEGKLPDHPAHPHGRIPIAHIYDVIKRVMGVPAKECRDSRFDDIIKISEFCRDNPDEPHCASALRPTIPSEPGPPSLEQFFIEEDTWQS